MPYATPFDQPAVCLLSSPDSEKRVSKIEEGVWNLLLNCNLDNLLPAPAFLEPSKNEIDVGTDFVFGNTGYKLSICKIFHNSQSYELSFCLDFTENQHVDNNEQKT